MNTRPRKLQAASLVATAALVLSACSGGDDDPTPVAEESASSEPTASQAADDEGNGKITPAGTQLTFGDAATVEVEEQGKTTRLTMRVESAQQGSLEDFQGFDLDDPYKKRGNYYYVRVAVRNTGKQAVGGVPVPLWGISGDNTLLQAVEFKSSFAKCPTEPLPKRFKPKDSFKTCLVYLSPDKGKLQGVSFRPTEQYAPIEWRGQVKMLPKAKKPKKGKGKQQ